MLAKIPNILTILRILMIPLFVYVFFGTCPKAHYTAFIVFLIAGLTDILDGYIARKYNLITKFGTAMDPLADKLMLLAALASLGIKGFLPIWLVVLMFVKEAIMIFVGLYMYFKKEKYVVPANKFGKAATLMFSLAIMAILFAPQIKELLYLVYAALILKLIAFLSYAIHHSKNIEKLR